MSDPEALLEGISPAPWTVYDRVADGDKQDHDEECTIRSSDVLNDWVAVDVFRNADARLIAAAPDLAARLGTAEAEVTALRAQLDEANAKIAGWERDWFDVQKPRLDEAVRLLRASAVEGAHEWLGWHEQRDAFLATVEGGHHE